MDTEILQESPTRKAAWLVDAMKRFPIGSRVRVVTSDMTAYIGLHGTVTGHDTGFDGDWPLVTVRLDNGIHDGFYGDGAHDDEIVQEESSHA